MNDVSGTLNKLIDVAERSLCCRQNGAPANIDEIACEVANMHSPVGVVLSDAPGLLLEALASFWRAAEHQRPLWLMAAAALLQITRHDLSQVIEARRRPLEPDTTYRTGGGMPRDERRSYQRR
jgi:hypothetical protein